MPAAVEKNDLDIPPPGTAEGFAERLSVKLEQALYEKFAINKDQINSNKKAKAKDVGPKYRTKFRSLSVILKDDKNPDLHKRIVTGELTPEEFVTLSRDELMNPALRQMAEAVRAESIRNSILKVDDGPRIRRTHKGEEYIEDAFEDKPEEQDWNTVSNNETSNADRENSADKVDLDKDVSENNAEQRSPSIIGRPQEAMLGGADYNNNNDNHSNSGDYDYNEGISEDNGMTIEDDDDLDEILNGTKSGYVGKPKYKEPVKEEPKELDEDAEYDPFYVASPSPRPAKRLPIEVVVFTGQVLMSMVSEFPGTAIHLSGPPGFDPYDSWGRVINDMSPLVIEGRLDRTVAAKYLQTVGQTKDIVSFILRSDESGGMRQFNKLFDYFSSKSKYGVIVRSRPSHGPQLMVKDAYLVTLKEGDPIPDHIWLTSKESQTRLESYLKTDKRVVIGLFVLANRVSDMAPAVPISTAHGINSSHQPVTNGASVTTDPQALLSLLQQMNGGPISQPPSKQYEYSHQRQQQHPYSADNDDEYEP